MRRISHTVTVCSQEIPRSAAGEAYTGPGNSGEAWGPPGETRPQVQAGDAHRELESRRAQSTAPAETTREPRSCLPGATAPTPNMVVLARTEGTHEPV